MNTTHNSQKKILEWSIILGIVIVLNLLFNYSLSVFYPSPEWNEFCPERPTIPQNEEQCVAEGGEWYDHGLKPSTDTGETGYCDVYASCQEDFNSERDVHNRLVFIILVVLGVIGLALGVWIKVATVGTGLAYGGVLSLVIASARYWPSADDYVKLLILAAALAALIWIGIKKFK